MRHFLYIQGGISCPGFRASRTQGGISCPGFRASHTQVGISCPGFRASHTQVGISCPGFRAGHSQVGILCPGFRADHSQVGISCPGFRTDFCTLCNVMSGIWGMILPGEQKSVWILEHHFAQCAMTMSKLVQIIARGAKSCPEFRAYK